jgi:hypothetical protein
MASIPFLHKSIIFPNLELLSSFLEIFSHAAIKNAPEVFFGSAV